jgi:photosystem II stability/assembly factor-like uncharacterized protein
MQARFKQVSTRFKVLSLATLAATPLLTVPQLSEAKPPQYSQIMPKAKKSLLLDVVRAGDRLVVAGDKGHILYSDDAKTWTQAVVPTTQMLTAVYFVDAKNGWAVGHDGLILKSVDGGENWTISLNGLAVQKQINIEKEQKASKKIQALEAALKTVSDSEKSQVLMDLDDAKYDLESAQATLSAPVFTSPLLDVWFADLNRGWASGAFGKMWATTDAGKTWVDASAQVGNEDGFHLNALAGTATGDVFAAGEMGMVLRSSDFGQSWEHLSLPYEGTLFTIACSESGDLLVAAGLRGNVFFSTDKGDTWTASNSNTDLSLAGAVVINSQNVLIVGSGGAVITSHDGAKNFALYSQENRLGMSSIAKAGDKGFVMVGLGGIHSFTEEPNP